MQMTLNDFNSVSEVTHHRRKLEAYLSARVVYLMSVTKSLIILSNQDVWTAQGVLPKIRLSVVIA